MLKLKEKKQKILAIWQDKIFETYPVKPSVPEIIGYIEECTEKIFDKFVEVYNGGSFEGIEEAVDDLMRYLAVDAKLTPGQSIEKILFLKELVLKEFSPDFKEFVKINNIVDKLACMAFDIYTKCREHIYELRLEQKEEEKKMLERVIHFAEVSKTAKHLNIDPIDDVDEH